MSSMVELQSPLGRGCLVVLESGRQVPFDVLRIFLLLDVPQDTLRGQHQLIDPDFEDDDIRNRAELERPTRQ